MTSRARLPTALVLLSGIGVESLSPLRFYNNDRYAAEVLPKRTPDIGLMFPIPGADNAAPAPEPTPAPTLKPFMLERRGTTDNTCAYVSGDSDTPLYCGTDSACIYNSSRSNIGCCPDSNSKCPLWTTCLGLSDSSKYTSSDGYTLLCGSSAYPHCVTHKYIDTLFFGYTLLGCGKTQTSDIVYYQATKTSARTTTTSRSSSSSSSSSPSSTTSVEPVTTTPAPEPQTAGTTNVGAIAGGVVGGVAAIGLIGLGAIFFVRRNRSGKSDPTTSPSAATATTAMHSPGQPPAPGMYGQPPPQMGQVPGYPPAPGFVPMGGAYDPSRDSMKYGSQHTQSVYDPNMAVSPPGSPPPPGHSPVGMAQSPTGTQFTGMTPQHTGTPPAPGMGHQSGPVAAYHELPAQRGDRELRELE